MTASLLNLHAFRHGAATGWLHRFLNGRAPEALLIAFYAIAALVTATLWIGEIRYSDLQHISTAIGEQSRTTLRDGTVVRVNTNSDFVFRMDAGERRAVLNRGEIFLSVKQNDFKPFVLSTPQALIRVRGTQFNVRADSERTAVAVLEGTVEISSNVDTWRRAPGGVSETAPVVVGAGSQIAVMADGHITAPEDISTDRVADWIDGTINFVDVPLGDIVAEINRYDTRVIRVSDPKLAAQRLGATFELEDMGAIFPSIERGLDARVDRSEDGMEIVIRPAAHRDDRKPNTTTGASVK